MPVYEYECKHCGNRFDKLQPITSEPLEECLLCGQGPIRRVFQPVGVIFKGSGWYINDNRQANKPKEAAVTKDDGKEASTKPESDSKESSSTSGNVESSPKAESASAQTSTFKETPKVSAPSE
ncbi:MAG: zinc ribbon domain-containing protein [Chloroflexi bacterium]|nr:zinc ribbon domain-containing protein [Chloroflexota bacterium]